MFLYGHISEIERGIKEPSFFVMVRIAKALGVPLDSLYKVIY
ncbi:MAG: helix-turn-helix transcriptional regulator [Clostridia bacterium]|nr:helix-turn-helix transcriptional regulator [Clostridia bacterium]